MSALSTRRSCQTIFHFLANTNSTTKSCLSSLVHIRNAHHKSESRANGSKNGPGKRLGAKKGSEEYVVPGNIIFRQRGTQWYPGENCDMGRDHTIFAKEAGYVQFYRDPHRHPRRRYIGVALERTWKLPTPLNAVRRRRLGMLAVERKDIDLKALSERHNTDITTLIPANPEPPMTDKEKRTVRRRQKSGLIPIKDLVMKRGYQWRMTNAEIGRIAERAEVQKPVYRKGDRFLAWRMRRRNTKRAALQRIAETETRRGKEKAKQKAKSEKDKGQRRR